MKNLKVMQVLDVRHLCETHEQGYSSNKEKIQIYANLGFESLHA